MYTIDKVGMLTQKEFRDDGTGGRDPGVSRSETGLPCAISWDVSVPSWQTTCRAGRQTGSQSTQPWSTQEREVKHMELLSTCCLKPPNNASLGFLSPAVRFGSTSARGAHMCRSDELPFGRYSLTMARGHMCTMSFFFPIV